MRIETVARNAIIFGTVVGLFIAWLTGSLGAQAPARFHFVSQDQITHDISIIVVKDTFTGSCQAIYRQSEHHADHAFSGIHVKDVLCARITK